MTSRAKSTSELQEFQLTIHKATLFDEKGLHGIWDILNRHIGVRNIPSRWTSPRPMHLRNQVTVTASPAGDIYISSPAGAAKAVDEVERLLCAHCNATWEVASLRNHYGRNQHGWNIDFGTPSARLYDNSGQLPKRTPHSSLGPTAGLSS
jgi:hypothetical protein